VAPDDRGGVDLAGMERDPRMAHTQPHGLCDGPGGGLDQTGIRTASLKGPYLARVEKSDHPGRGVAGVAVEASAMFSRVIGTWEVAAPPASASSGWRTRDASDLIASARSRQTCITADVEGERGLRSGARASRPVRRGPGF
jgi:hypothetical protein